MRANSPKPTFAISLLFRKKKHPPPFSTISHQPGHKQRRQDEQSRGVRVSVWWDFENCNLPVNSNVFKVAQRIMSAVRAVGIRGPVRITAFGDVMQISRTNQEALSATGINITHVPSGGKNSADRSLLVNLLYWISCNPPPAHVFLISGDRDFASILHRLRMDNYNILLASPDSAPSVLCSSATVMWQWSALLRGENLTGKFYNQPPDGGDHDHDSWYGRFKFPLEDPFACAEQTTAFPDEAPDATKQQQQLRPVPKAVIRSIRRILSAYPDGVPISVLREELAKSNQVMDSDFYGAKKFSRFLLALPHVAKLNFSDGRIIARKASDVETSSSDNGESEVGSGEEFEKEGRKTKKPCDPKPKECPSNRSIQEGDEEQEKKAKSTEGSSLSADCKTEEGNVIVSDHDSEDGIFRRTWRKLFATGNEKKQESYGIVDRILRLFRFRGVEKRDKPPADASTVHPEKPEIFCQESFWQELASFIDSSSGKAVFAESPNRKQLVQNLLEKGPQSVKSLSEDDLHRLVELLVSERKWIEEDNDSASSPFKIVRGGSNNNGLSHIFLAKQEEPSAAESKLKNPSRFNNKPAGEVLADCYELVDRVVKYHPDGYNLGMFRKLFFERYGYSLDVKKLGHSKLVDLVMNNPGVRVESNRIFPAESSRALEDSDEGIFAESSTKNEDSEWDELGPEKPPSIDDDYEAVDGNEGPSESEGESPCCDSKKSEGRPPEISSLLEILDSWQVEKRGAAAEEAESTTAARKRNPARKYSFVTEHRPQQPDGKVGLVKESGESRMEMWRC